MPKPKRNFLVFLLLILLILGGCTAILIVGKDNTIDDIDMKATSDIKTDSIAKQLIDNN